MLLTDARAPVFYNASNSNSEIDTGESVQWWCYANGVPSPTISWYKVSNIHREPIQSVIRNVV